MKIVIVSHDDTRTGAPILLINLARLLKQKGGHEIIFLIKNKSGAVYEQFNELFPTYFWSYHQPGKRQWLFHTFRTIKEKKEWRRAARFIADADVVLSNTITNGDIIEEVGLLTKAPVISYIHELEIATASFTTPSNVQRLINRSTAFLVPSKAVQLFLQQSYNISPDRISILNYYIPPAGIEKVGAGRIRKNEKFVIGASGTADWRKGIDVFLLVVKRCAELFPEANLYFIWKGVNQQSIEYQWVAQDIKKAGLQHMVELLPADAGMMSFYQSLDVFLLTSREDPYPLVVLEAATYGKPTICFEGGGGAVEFVAHNAGTAVPFLSIEAMAQAIIHYYRNTAVLHDQGNNAMQSVAALHQDPVYLMNQFSEAIKPNKNIASN